MAGPSVKFKIQWHDHERWPTCLPDLRYPEGIDLDVSEGAKTACRVPLPYPAKRCGHFLVHCLTCGMTVACTTAGRIDDPRSIKLPCQKK